MDFKFIFALVFASFLAITERIFQWVYELVPYPFIDEAFHVPQAIKYCNGTYNEWDPKITTLPGLYLFSVASHKIFGMKTCSLYTLRLGNTLLASFIFILLYRILRRFRMTQKGYSRKIVLWHAFNLSIFPVSYFFTFLYYTDTISTCLVLLMIDLHLASRRGLASIVGIMSCIARQVNIVWVGYLLLVSLSKSVNEYLEDPALRSTMKQLRRKNTLAVLWSYKIPAAHFLRLAQRIIEDTSYYVAACCLFVVFVAYNRGIVVGDRSAHEAVIHLPQMFYFAAFYVLSTLPHSAIKAPKFFQSALKRPISFTILTIAIVAVTYSNTLVHPYVLADNRHLTFYLWNKILSKPIFRYLLVPVYLFGVYVMHDLVESTNYELATWLALLIALVPQKLLELRYFIIPYYICRFHVRSNNTKVLSAETAINLASNALVLYVFYSKQFYWPDFVEPQRIIW